MRTIVSVTIPMLAMLAPPATAQQAREATFFSNRGLSGAQYTVTGPREILDLPFEPRSVVVRGGGSWQVCSARRYAGTCATIARTERDLRLAFRRVASARPLGVTAPSGWRDIARMKVPDRRDQDTAFLDDRQRYRQIMVCGERRTVRIRQAQVQLEDGRWQRLALPLVLTPGRCSKPVMLDNRRGSRIRAIRFHYQAWTAGHAGATLVVRALPHIAPQPR